MSPKGIYLRKKKQVETPAKTSAKTAVQEADVANKKAAEDVLSQVQQAAREIGAMYSRIENTVMDIGKRLFEVKQTLDASANLRKFGVPVFSRWMNNEAPELCNMSKRTVWSHYQAYTEAQIAGLSEKTITALAPTLLKSEKTRKAVTETLARHPELVLELNSAARNPAKIREIAKSEEVQGIIAKVKNHKPEPSMENRQDRIKRTVLTVLKPLLDVSQENFNLQDANQALKDLVYGVVEATKELGVQQFATIFYIPMKPEDVAARFANTQKPPQPADLQEAVKAGVTRALAAAATAA